MVNVYGVNGLRCWSQHEIMVREHAADYFAHCVHVHLSNVNPAWAFRRCQTPILTPRDRISDSYNESDVWVQQRLTENDHNLVLRPETTPGTYQYLIDAFEHKTARPPICAWQAGLSFRREQDQPSKFVRLKEFHQQEFQAVYTSDTKCDYHAVMLEPVQTMLSRFLGVETRLVESDRLHSYSEITMDVEVPHGDRWMEICSISRRTDFPLSWSYTHKGQTRTVDLMVLEIAIGLDRCVDVFTQKPILDGVKP